MKTFHRFLAAVALAMTACGSATAQPAAGYPAKAIRLVVGYSVGGGTDLVARLLAQEFSRVFGQPVIVDNRPGADGALGAETVARADPDGYTLLVSPSGPMTMNPAVRSDLPYSMRDFVPVSLLVRLPFLIGVEASLPVRTLDELVGYARDHPDSVSYAASGLPFQLAAEMLKQQTDTKFIMIPYKSSSESAAALVSKQVTMAITDVPPMAALIRSNRIRALAYTGQARSATFPDVPTVAEAGYGKLDVYTWVGLLAPKGIAPEIVRKLQDEAVEAVNQPAMQQRFLTIGAEKIGGSSEAFAQAIKDESARWSAVAKAANIRFE